MENGSMCMVLGWFNAKDAEEFGNTLAVFFDEKFRANEKAKDHKIVVKQQKLIADILSKAQQFKTRNKLNAYQKAKLGNAFKWKLRDLGHDSALIDLMTKDLMVALK
jgi:hypothetical protein